MVTFGTPHVGGRKAEGTKGWEKKENCESNVKQEEQHNR